MILNALLSLIAAVIPIQMAVFAWKLSSSGSKNMTFGQVYVASWKAMGSGVRWLFSPFFESKR